MTLAGWIIMLCTVGGMTSLFGWCVYKVLTTPGETERIHSQANIDPHDQE